MKALRPSLKLSLLISVSAVMALSACGQGMKDKLYGTEGRKQQSVDGARRVPMLNPQVVPSSEAPIMQPPRPTVEAPPPVMPPQQMPRSQAVDPYDQYDAHGNLIGNSPAMTTAAAQEDDEDSMSLNAGDIDSKIPSGAPQSTAETKPTVGEYFSGFFGGNKEAAPAQANAARKPISENPVYMRETTPEAPLPPAPQVEPRPTVNNSSFEQPRDTVSGFQPVNTPSYVTGTKAEEAPVAKMETPAPKVMEHPRPSFFERLGSVFKEPRVRESQPGEQASAEDSAVVSKGDMEKDIANHAQREQEYPALSSVPPTPESFKSVKAEKDARLQELQIDHAMAQESKQELNAEPSQVDSTPVVTAAPSDNGTKIVSSGSSGPVLLGQISDGKPAAADAGVPATQNVPAPVEYKVDKIVEAAPAAAPAPVIIEEKTQAESTPWWKRWNIMGDKHANEEVTETAPAEASFAPAAPAPVAQPLVDNRPASTVPAFTPVAAPREIPAPVEYVADDKPADTNTDSSTASTGGTDANGLPNPQMLKKVKTLPPSRYNARARQYYLVP